MSNRRNRRTARKASLPMITALVVVASCHGAPVPVMTAAPPTLPQQQLSVPVSRAPAPLAQSLIAPPDTAAEEHIKIDTFGREVDVRTILDFIAERAGVHFAYSPDINKKIRITLVDVPVSQALQAVLSTANLTLENSGSAAKRSSMPSVVFYQLPVNIDSLPVDAIMRRFGVSREIAEILVQGRSAKP